LELWRGHHFWVDTVVDELLPATLIEDAPAWVSEHGLAGLAGDGHDG